tara:strand:+ start:171 stop:377 length:207 start_codon:yes stop_codon:yes gene_type:complete
MKLLIGLCGYILLMLGVVLGLHYDMTLGVLIMASGVFMFWAMLPSVDQNERLRRYERQHQKWLRGRHE